MTLVQLESFLAVVDTGSFSKAATMLNMTQSGVTHHIKNLESELNIQLFVRGRSGIKLTYSGERILQYARDIQLSTRCILEESNAFRGIHKGTIRVGTISSVYSTFISSFIKDFCTAFPDIDLTLYEGSRQDVVTWIHDSVIDVGFLSLCDDMNDPISTIPLMRDYMFVLSSDIRHAGNDRSITIEDFSNLPIILPKTDSDDFLEKFFKEREIKLNIQFQVRDTATILAMVRQGLGVTLLPQSSIPSELSNMTVLRPTFRPFRVLGLGLRSNTDISPIVQLLVNHVQAFVRDQSKKLEIEEYSS